MPAPESINHKISPQFAARLKNYSPEQKVRVIVLLKSNNNIADNSQRQSRLARKAAIQAMQQSVQQAAQEIDRIIQDYGGKKLAKQPNILGTIPIEITPPGIQALALSDSVKAIIENQKIHSIHHSNIS
ncbi:MAG: hypothetical protein QNJ55_21640 [Xenococcus sp. MO_188.B8]|nr:hypothetical protein [Xenococcus sp. MO_188.B8]